MAALCSSCRGKTTLLLALQTRLVLYRDCLRQRSACVGWCGCALMVCAQEDEISWILNEMQKYLSPNVKVRSLHACIHTTNNNCRFGGQTCCRRGRAYGRWCVTRTPKTLRPSRATTSCMLTRRAAWYAFCCVVFLLVCCVGFHAVFLTDNDRWRQVDHVPRDERAHNQRGCQTGV